MSSPGMGRLTEPTDAGVLRLVRLENRGAGSEKFYTVIVEVDPAVPGRFRCRAEWGRIGTTNVSQQGKGGGGQQDCERRLDDIVREKRGRGYSVVCDERATASAAKPREPTAARSPEGERLSDLMARRRREATWSF